MGVLVGILFVAAAASFVALTMLMILRIGFGRLESRIGIARDGPRRGAPAPTWRAIDLDAVPRATPNGRQWQLLIFADYALSSFPDLVAGLNHMRIDLPDLEILVLARRSGGLDAETVDELGIAVPVVVVDQEFYHRFGVRVMPYGVILDPAGEVRWADVANYEHQLLRELAVAQGKAQRSPAAPALSHGVA